MTLPDGCQPRACHSPAPLHRSVAALLPAALLALGLAGCVTTRVEHSKSAATGIAAHESVAVLATSYHKQNGTESGFLECVTEQLDDGSNPLRVMRSDAFVDALFPWFEPRTMPTKAESLPELMARPGVADAINKAGVRYVVWVDGKTERSRDGGTLSCAVGLGGGGCFGFLWWENDGEYEASVWDLRNAVAAGEVSSNAHGTSMVPAVIIPVPLIARTATAACKNLANELKTFIQSEGAT